MNDRFRFRAWNKEEKEYYYDAEKTYDYLNGIMSESFGELLEDDRYIVEQCTGIVDCNGKLIYEGDILRAICTDGTQIDYPVGWWDGAFHMYHINRDLIAKTGTIEFCLRGLAMLKNCNHREIIGNIHEMEIEKCPKCLEKTTSTREN